MITCLLIFSNFFLYYVFISIVWTIIKRLIADNTSSILKTQPYELFKEIFFKPILAAWNLTLILNRFTLSSILIICLKKQNVEISLHVPFQVVSGGGLEPPWYKPHGPQPCASAKSATPTYIYLYF